MNVLNIYYFEKPILAAKLPSMRVLSSTVLVDNSLVTAISILRNKNTTLTANPYYLLLTISSLAIMRSMRRLTRSSYS